MPLQPSRKTLSSPTFFVKPRTLTESLGAHTFTEAGPGYLLMIAYHRSKGGRAPAAGVGKGHGFGLKQPPRFVVDHHVWWSGISPQRDGLFGRGVQRSGSVDPLVSVLCAARSIKPPLLTIEMLALFQISLFSGIIGQVNPTSVSPNLRCRLALPSVSL